MNEEVKKLISNYIKQFQVHSEINYEDKASIKRGNKAVDRMISLAKKTSEYPDGILEFRKLLNSENSSLSLWVSHHILEYMDYAEQDEKTALQHIREAAETEYGEKIWLEEWKDKKNELFPITACIRH